MVLRLPDGSRRRCLCRETTDEKKKKKNPKKHSGSASLRTTTTSTTTTTAILNFTERGPSVGRIPGTETMLLLFCKFIISL